MTAHPGGPKETPLKTLHQRSCPSERAGNGPHGKIELGEGRLGVTAWVHEDGDTGTARGGGPPGDCMWLSRTALGDTCKLFPGDPGLKLVGDWGRDVFGASWGPQ